MRKNERRNLTTLVSSARLFQRSLLDDSIRRIDFPKKGFMIVLIWKENIERKKENKPSDRSMERKIRPSASRDNAFALSLWKERNASTGYFRDYVRETEASRS